MPFDSSLAIAWPADSSAWAGLAAAVLALGFAAVARRLPHIGWRWWITIWALASVVASLLYVHVYLQGGPRIIDATSYWLEARGLSHGLVSWPADEPTASFRGRFLIHTLEGDGTMRVGVIFPPGYPAVLALGFLVGQPMLIGPMLAGVLTALAATLGKDITGSEDVGRIVAVLASLNACLRYHTADTMSHGLAAVLVALAFVSAWRAAGSTKPWWWIVCGLATGWLAATRPATALAVVAIGLPVITAWMVRYRRWSPLWALCVAALPLAGLMLHQRLLTGAWFTSSQTKYYLVADGPPGCFRYGFGEGIGCLVEHGAYVESVAREGYHLLTALRISGRRLYLHVTDVLNYAPFAVLVAGGVIAGRRAKSTYLLVSVPLVLLAAYAPFYFDGSYPGGGARMISEALAFEHVLAAIALCWWGGRFREPERGRRWAVGAAVACCCLGYAFHASHLHRLLRDRDGGRPFFEPEHVVAALGPQPRGLLFVDTDHGFNLAHDPSARDPSSTLVVARARYDDRDRLLWERLGRPATWRYRYEPWANTRPPHVEAWTPPTSTLWLFEAEAEWPPVDQWNGYAAPTHLAPNSCVSSGRALALHRVGNDHACVVLSIPVPDGGPHRMRTWMVAPTTPSVEMWIERNGDRHSIPLPRVERVEAWPGAVLSDPDRRYCLPSMEVEVRAGDRWVVCTDDAWLALDRVELRKPNGGGKLPQ